MAASLAAKNRWVKRSRTAHTRPEPDTIETATQTRPEVAALLAEEQKEGKEEVNQVQEHAAQALPVSAWSSLSRGLFSLVMQFMERDLGKLSAVCPAWRAAFAAAMKANYPPKLSFESSPKLNFESWFHGVRKVNPIMFKSFCSWFRQHWGTDLVKDLTLGKGPTGPLSSLVWDQVMVDSLITLLSPGLVHVDIRGCWGLCLPNSVRHGCPGAGSKPLASDSAAILSFLHKVVKKIGTHLKGDSKQFFRMRFLGCRMSTEIASAFHKMYEERWQNTINLQVMPSELCSVKLNCPRGKPHEIPAYCPEVCAFCVRRLCRAHGPVMTAGCKCVEQQALRISSPNVTMAKTARKSPAICEPCAKKRGMRMCGCACAHCLFQVLACQGVTSCNWFDSANARQCNACHTLRCKACIRPEDWTSCPSCRADLCATCEPLKCSCRGGANPTPS
eukprot:gb/GEZN01005496.1/.p1 GENE.gb/GEZN01005496.1/~~gb/GEZN01005496.1/.p1  ORF type:complete len:518 (-),score=34.08 gb/GEZN01005496.1/:243-1580(-)